MAGTGDGRQRELDGVRGVAILLVLAGHGAAPWGLAAFGGAGVTVFFVLSGYLITGALLAERRRTGALDLRRFYARRMTRLAPPLFVMVAVVSALAWPGWGAVLPALTWTANYARVAGVHPVPFDHTWSLGVEEQFYLVWPVALLLLLRTRRAVLALTAVVGALVLWRAAVTTVGTYEALYYAYNAFETAGSAILVGCLVRLAGWRLRPVWAAVAFAGLVAVAGAATGTAVAWLAVPLVATPLAGVLLAAAQGATWLQARWLVWCGMASYSLYLWHHPVSQLLPGVAAPVGVALGTAVGAVAYHLVEQPVMRWRARPAAPAPLPVQA